MARHKIPTARYQSFTDPDAAEAFIHEMGAPVVVKADGLAAGKGVILAQSEQEAIAAMRGMLSGADFGEAGRQVVIEEFLHGEEASFIVATDGETILPLALVAGSQGPRQRRPGSQHRRHGRLFAGPVVSRNCTSASWPRSSSRPCAAWRRRVAVMSGFSTPG